MPPSLSRLERGNPPPRRKSCLACTKAKRRCDQKLPSCFRCTQRQLVCNYASRPRPQPQPQPQPLMPLIPDPGPGPGPLPPTTLSRTTSSPEPDQQQMFDLTWTPEDAQVHNMCSNVPLLDTLGSSGGPLLSFQDSDMLDWAMDRGESQRTTVGNGLDEPKFPDQPMFVFAPWKFDFESVNKTVDTRLAYAIASIKAAPRTMVLETQAPWCHPLLYRHDMPRSIQDVSASCALYIAKNAVNAPVIMRCIEAKVNHLLASPVPSTPLDILARTQALLLYQIIRLFDGDIGARASAETIFADLESSASALSNHIIWTPDPTSQEQDLPLFPIEASRDFWTSWIFQESARRTFLITFFFINTWHILTGRTPIACDNHLDNACQTWTLSAHLWEAKDAFEFAVAWRVKRHLVVTKRNIMNVVTDAGGDDFDVFGKMLISAAVGIEEAKGWLLTKGGSL